MSTASSTVAKDGIRLPESVRYVKNGREGQWWQAAHDGQEIQLGWRTVPNELLLKPDFAKIRKILKAQDFNALQTLLDAPSKHVWITFEDGYMWWCTVLDGSQVVNPAGQSTSKGNFWLKCDHPWTNHSLKGTPLAKTDLPGPVTTSAGFKGTVCQPRAWREILRVIRGEKDPDAARATRARANYQCSLEKVIVRLSWQDFEQLIDLVLTRTGWARVSTLGKTQKGIDLKVQNRTTDETAYVQVKSSATQNVLNEYIADFSRQRNQYSRMIFAVHSPQGELRAASEQPVQIWNCNRVAELAVYAGLGEWVESRLP